MSRIIAGSAKGARLKAPAGANTRPTTDRTREALFSSLVTWFDCADAETFSQLAGVEVLDLFAGSGAIGLESASRGASVTLVEKAKPAAAVITANMKATRLSAKLANCTVESFLESEPRPFDLVWLDPPYGFATAKINSLIARLTEGWLGADALVVVERSVRDEPPTWPARYDESWQKKYGETALYYARCS